MARLLWDHEIKLFNWPNSFVENDFNQVELLAICSQNNSKLSE